MKPYESRVSEYESQGISRSDAQAIVDLEDEKNRRYNAFPNLAEALAMILKWIDGQKRIGKLPDIDFPSAKDALAKAEGKT